MTDSDDCGGDSDTTGGDGGGGIAHGDCAAVLKKKKTTTAASHRNGGFSAGALLLTPAVTTVLCALLLVTVLPQPRLAAGSQLYTNTFAVKLHGYGRDGDGHVDEEVAHRVAKRAGSGFENVGKVRENG